MPGSISNWLEEESVVGSDVWSGSDSLTPEKPRISATRSGGSVEFVGEKFPRLPAVPLMFPGVAGVREPPPAPPEDPPELGARRTAENTRTSSCCMMKLSPDSSWRGPSMATRTGRTSWASSPEQGIGRKRRAISSRLILKLFRWILAIRPSRVAPAGMLHRPSFHPDADFTKKDPPSEARRLSTRPRTRVVIELCWGLVDGCSPGAVRHSRPSAAMAAILPTCGRLWFIRVPDRRQRALIYPRSLASPSDKTRCAGPNRRRALLLR